MIMSSLKTKTNHHKPRSGVENARVSEGLHECHTTSEAKFTGLIF